MLALSLYMIDEIIKEIQLMQIELMYKGKALVDINEVLDILRNHKEKDSLTTTLEKLKAML